MDRVVLGTPPVTIRVVANTHGAISQAVLDAVQGCDLIVHAGDIGDVAWLEALRAVGRVVAVRGNSDRHAPLSQLPEVVEIGVGATRMLAVHNHATLPWSPAEAGFRVVISGLWHHPSVNERDGVIIVSPGSVAAGWTGMPLSIAQIVVTNAGLHPIVMRIEEAPGPLENDIVREGV